MRGGAAVPTLPGARKPFGEAALFRRLAGPPAEYKSRCEPGSQSVRAHPANKRGFRLFSGVS